MKNFPDPATITSLARGLGVGEKEVLHASARSLGLMLDDDAAGLTIAGAASLPGGAIRAIMDVARVLMNAHAATESGVPGGG